MKQLFSWWIPTYRENILPSERAWAYRMKKEAIRHQGARHDLTSPQVGEKLNWAVKQVAEDANISQTQVERYISLTELIPELLDMVDQKKIAFTPAVAISALKPNEQRQFLDAMDISQNTPSLSQAQRIKKLSQANMCTQEAIENIMSEEKKDDLSKVIISHDVLRKYFPKSYTPKQMETQIIKLLDQWYQKKNRNQGIGD